MDSEVPKKGWLGTLQIQKTEKKGMLDTNMNSKNTKDRLSENYYQFRRHEERMVKKTMDLEGTKEWQVWHQYEFKEHKRKAD